jgi:hypothetical protein
MPTTHFKGKVYKHEDYTTSAQKKKLPIEVQKQIK